MAIFIPRPVRDVVECCLNTQRPGRSVARAKSSPVAEAISATFGGRVYSLGPAERVICAIARVTIAVSVVFTALALGLAVATSGMLVSLALSIPSAVLVGGSWLLYNGVTAVVASLVSGSFAALGKGLAYTALGYVVLEFHDALPFGLLEETIQSKAIEVVASGRSFIPSFSHIGRYF